jgi:S-formylglutathione hydrolase FrmB
MGWQRLEVESAALVGNPLGDPHLRTLHVWTPADTSRRYPAVYVIQGFSGMVDSWFNVSPFVDSYAIEIERLAPEAVIVLVDAFTAIGGSQFVDSPATGRYHTYLCDDVVPFVDAHFPTLAAREHRGIQGKSSGGYGAMITPLMRPDLWGALATHAGDALFETCYQPEFPVAARALRDGYDGSYERFWDDFHSRPAWSKKTDPVLMDSYAMAACYSANEDGSIDFPFELATGELRPDVWERWLALDPVRMARKPEHRETLRNLRGVWIDAGKADDYNLDLGAEAFYNEVVAAGTPGEAVRFELFDGTHSGITWRYPLSLAWLVERLSITL